MGGPHGPIFFCHFFISLQNGEHGQKGPYGFTKLRVIPHLSSFPIVVGTSLILRGHGGPNVARHPWNLALPQGTPDHFLKGVLMLST